MSGPYVKTSDKTGAGVWIKERASSVVLIPLTLWAIVIAVAVVGMSHAEARAFVAQPINAVVIGLTVLVGAYHMHLGVRVIIEDYLRGPVEKLLLVLNALGCLILAGAGLVLVILIALGG